MERAREKEVGWERGRNKRGKGGRRNNGKKEERWKRRGLEVGGRGAGKLPLNVS